PADLLGDVRVLARRELRGALDDRHAASEAPKHLPELEPDISAPEYQEVLRQLGQLHDGGRVERRDAIDPRQRRASRPAAGVDEDQRRGKLLGPTRALHLDRVGADAPRLAHQQIEPGGAFDATLAARAKGLDDVALAPA